jgi:hypothetical protein
VKREIFVKITLERKKFRLRFTFRCSNVTKKSLRFTFWPSETWRRNVETLTPLSVRVRMATEDLIYDFLCHSIDDESVEVLIQFVSYLVYRMPQSDQKCVRWRVWPADPSSLYSPAQPHLSQFFQALTFLNNLFLCSRFEFE